MNFENKNIYLNHNFLLETLLFGKITFETLLERPHFFLSEIINVQLFHQILPFLQYNQQDYYNPDDYPEDFVWYLIFPTIYSYMINPSEEKLMYFNTFSPSAPSTNIISDFLNNEDFVSLLKWAEDNSSSEKDKIRLEFSIENFLKIKMTNHQDIIFSSSFFSQKDLSNNNNIFKLSTDEKDYWLDIVNNAKWNNNKSKGITIISVQNNSQTNFGAHTLEFYNWDFSANNPTDLSGIGKNGKNIFNATSSKKWDPSTNMIVGIPGNYIDICNQIILPIGIKSSENSENTISNTEYEISGNLIKLYSVLGAPIITNVVNIFNSNIKEIKNNVQFVSHNKFYSSSSRFFVMKLERGAKDEEHLEPVWMFASDPSFINILPINNLTFERNKFYTFYFKNSNSLFNYTIFLNDNSTRFQDFRFPQEEIFQEFYSSSSSSKISDFYYKTNFYIPSNVLSVNFFTNIIIIYLGSTKLIPNYDDTDYRIFGAYVGDCVQIQISHLRGSFLYIKDDSDVKILEISTNNYRIFRWYPEKIGTYYFNYDNNDKIGKINIKKNPYLVTINILNNKNIPLKYYGLDDLI